MPEQPPALSDSQSLVYIFRAPAFALAGRGSIFFIDDVKVVVLGHSGCTLMVVPSGHHILKQRWPLDVSWGRNISAPVDWEVGRTYYYKIDTSVDIGYQTMTFTTDLRAADKIEDATGSKGCRFTPAFDLDKLKASEPAVQAPPVQAPDGTPDRQAPPDPSRP